MSRPNRSPDEGRGHFRTTGAVYHGGARPADLNRPNRDLLERLETVAGQGVGRLRQANEM